MRETGSQSSQSGSELRLEGLWRCRSRLRDGWIEVGAWSRAVSLTAGRLLERTLKERVKGEREDVVQH